MAEEEALTCFNKGCGQKFKVSENTETSCRHHPGEHFFHDAYKGWTCCNRKTVDFTEFLNMKGCAYSFHSNEKPPEVIKKTEVINDIVEVKPAQPIYKPMKRPSPDVPMVSLNKELSESLQTQTYSSEGISKGKTEKNEEEIIPGITQCLNKGCGVVYEGPQSCTETCNHHPGVPIFHEGLKFWSCCQKRTTEFEVFMQQKGCTTGSHLWTKPVVDSQDQTGAKVIKCRNDWHQTGSHVIIVVYGKKFDPHRSEVKANGVKLSIEMYFPEEGGYYRDEWILAGIVIPDQCSALMTPMKVEIKLKKAEPVKWKDFALCQDYIKEMKIQESKNEHSVGVDALDLSDL